MIGKMFQITLCAGLISQASAQQTARLVELDSVAQEMRFPKDYLKVSDKTIEMRKKFGGRVLKAEEVSGIEANIFHPMALIVSESDVLLTGDFIRKADSYLEANRAKPDKQKLLRRIEMSDGSWGYAGVEGFGPGGAIFSMTITNQGKQRDVKIMLSCKSDALTPIAGSDSYHKLISGELDSTQAMTAIAAAVIKTAQHVESATQTNLDLPNEVAPLRAMNKKQKLGGGESQGPIQFSKSFGYREWGAIATLAFFLAFLALKSWKR